MDVEPIQVDVLAGGSVLVGGEAIAAPAGMDPYAAAMAILADYARSSGSPVVACATEHASGETELFQVHGDGSTRAYVPPPAMPSFRPSAPPLFTFPEDGPEAFDHDVAQPERPLLRRDAKRPRGGVRGAVYNASHGRLNLGPSARELEEEDLERRIARPLSGSFNTAVLSLKGGIGKTSTTVGVGLTMAEFRGDNPCGIDANPDSGDLAERALGEVMYQRTSPRSITDIVRDIGSINSLTSLADYTHRAGRLHLVAGEQDPGLSDSLTAAEYEDVHHLISQYYSVTLTDCGTGVSHPAMAGVLQRASNVVVASGYAVSGAKRARNTLQWLADHGYGELARNAVVVITDKEQVSNRVDKKAIEDYLSGFCREVVTVPHDRTVADGDIISLDRVAAGTRRAYKEIAAAIVDGYR